MFHDIPKVMLDRMAQLEAIDSKDRTDGSTRLKRLRQIPAETGKFLALLATGAPAGKWIEIGTSAGYSAMWLSLACREMGVTLKTFEVLQEKVLLATETFQMVGINDLVELVHGDAREKLPEINDIAFCFLDAEKEVYADCYEAVIPKLVPGGILIADNAISHQSDLQPLLNRATQDERVDAMVLPIGKGELLCRKQYNS